MGRLTQLKRVGIRRSHVGTKRLRRLYGALLQPMWTLGSTSRRGRIKSMNWQTSSWINLQPGCSRRLSGPRGFPCVVNSEAWMPKYSIMCRRRDCIIDLWLASCFPQSEPHRRQIAWWKRLEDSTTRMRKIGDCNKIGMHALWDLPTVNNATSAANWLFGLFP